MASKAIVIETVPVSSSQIKSLGYFDGVLIVEFTGGSKYLYSSVNKHTYQSLVKADSIGSFFSNNIKNDESIKCIKLN